jgi:hypothetical protein
MIKAPFTKGLHNTRFLFSYNANAIHGDAVSLGLLQDFSTIQLTKHACIRLIRSMLGLGRNVGGTFFVLILKLLKLKYVAHGRELERCLVVTLWDGRLELRLWRVILVVVILVHLWELLYENCTLK